MSNEKKQQDMTGNWERLNVQLQPAQYKLLNVIKSAEHISLGEVSRIMFDIAISVLKDDYPEARNRAAALTHVSAETLRKYTPK